MVVALRLQGTAAVARAAAAGLDLVRVAPALSVVAAIAAAATTAAGGREVPPPLLLLFLLHIH